MLPKIAPNWCSECERSSAKCECLPIEEDFNHGESCAGTHYFLKGESICSEEVIA